MIVAYQPDGTLTERREPDRRVCVCVLVAAGSSRASWLCRLDPPSPAVSHTDVPSRRPADSDEASLSSGAPSDGRPPRQPAERPSPDSPPSAASSSPCGSASEPLKESDILSDEDDDFAERLSGRSESPPSAIEAQFRQLRLSEEQAAGRAPAPRVQPEGGEVDTPERRPPLSPREPGPGLQRAHFCPIKRKSGGSLRRSQGPGALLSMHEHSRSLDSQADAAVAPSDLNSLLEREFSVQSLTSVINEDCFYEAAESGDSSAATASS